MRTPVLGLLLVASCGAPPEVDTLSGLVVDVWGDPVAHALVLVDGLPMRAFTDSAGRYQLPIDVGEHKLLVGSKGFIQTDAAVKVGEDRQIPQFKLYPSPTEPGFHLVGASGYVALPSSLVESVSSGVEYFYGIKDPGKAEAVGSPVRVVFHEPRLKQSQLERLRPEVHRLEYVRTQEVTSLVSGEADIFLWVSKGVVGSIEDMVGLGSRADWLLTLSDDLGSGTYAIGPRQALQPKSNERFFTLTDTAKTVYSFEVR